MKAKDIGQVTGVTIRTVQGWLHADGARLTGGQGLDSDVHADPLSPRQLLLASAEVYDAFSLPPHALHENLLVDFDTAQLVSGTVLQVGDAVQLRLMFQCEACGQLDTQQPGLSRRLGMRRGMLARVLAGGAIQRGDRVKDLGMQHLPWSDDWRERIAQVLNAVPPGCVIEYKHLAPGRRAIELLPGVPPPDREARRTLRRQGGFFAVCVTPGALAWSGLISGNARALSDPFVEHRFTAVAGMQAELRTAPQNVGRAGRPFVLDQVFHLGRK